MGSCAAPSAKGDDKFITTDYLQQCLPRAVFPRATRFIYVFFVLKSFRESEGKIYLHYQLLIEPLGG
uniref:Replication initiator protein n=1 Tax=Klebsiella pneumoniae TaxID=573 RepID=A0A483ZA49_KLEPN